MTARIVTERPELEDTFANEGSYKKIAGALSLTAEGAIKGWKDNRNTRLDDEHLDEKVKAVAVMARRIDSVIGSEKDARVVLIALLDVVNVVIEKSIPADQRASS